MLFSVDELREFGAIEQFLTVLQNQNQNNHIDQYENTFDPLTPRSNLYLSLLTTIQFS